MGTNAEADARPETSGKPHPGLLIMNAELVEQIADEILREEAWWIGARTGQYVVKATLWADGRCVIDQAPWPRVIGAGGWITKI